MRARSRSLRGAVLALSRVVKLRSAFLGVVCTFVCVAGARAQTDHGALRGAVRDPLGVIPAAEVVLINEGTNAERSAMTNEDGEYTFTSVPSGTYTVRVALPGFTTEERTDFRIGTRQSAVLDFILDVGAISEQTTSLDHQAWLPLRSPLTTPTFGELTAIGGGARVVPFQVRFEF